MFLSNNALYFTFSRLSEMKNRICLKGSCKPERNTVIATAEWNYCVFPICSIQWPNSSFFCRCFWCLITSRLSTERLSGHSREAVSSCMVNGSWNWEQACLSHSRAELGIHKTVFHSEIAGKLWDALKSALLTQVHSRQFPEQKAAVPQQMQRSSGWPWLDLKESTQHFRF